jgi:hypothetical protein
VGQGERRLRPSRGLAGSWPFRGPRDQVDCSAGASAVIESSQGGHGIADSRAHG